MIDLENLYFEWLLTRLDPESVAEGVEYVAEFLHGCPFRRRVGHDANRADDGTNLRSEFMQDFSDVDFDPRITNDFMDQECSWFEMMVALSRRLDFLYEGGVEERFIELVDNMRLGDLITSPSQERRQREIDQQFVDETTEAIDQNEIDEFGRGGMFPLRGPGQPNQRDLEIWDQQAAYFREKLEGVLWTSTS